MRTTIGTQSDLTAAITEAIAELNAGVTPPSNNLTSCRTRLNELLVRCRSSLPAASGVLANVVSRYNQFANTYIRAVMVAEREMTGGVRYTSPQVTIPQYMTAIWIQLVCSDWTAHVGLGTVDFGIEYSTDGGSNWIIAAGAACLMGVYGKGTNMPSVMASGMNRITGAIWRIYVLASSTIDIGLRGVFKAWL